MIQFTKQSLLGVISFSTNVLYLFQDPIQFSTLYVGIITPQSSSVCGASQSFLVSQDLDSLEYCSYSLQSTFKFCFFFQCVGHDQSEVINYWEEYPRYDVSFSEHHLKKYRTLKLKCLIIGNFNLDYLVEIMSAMFIHYKVLFLSL